MNYRTPFGETEENIMFAEALAKGDLVELENGPVVKVTGVRLTDTAAIVTGRTDDGRIERRSFGRETIVQVW